jgi:hypothetical protein
VTTTTPGYHPGPAPSAGPLAPPIRGLHPPSPAVTDLVPFRPVDAASRAEAQHLLAQGLVRRVVADVLVAFDAPDSTEVRCAAVALLLGPRPGGDPGWVVGFGSAAWLHAGTAAVGVVPARLDVILQNGRRRPRSGAVRGRQVVLPREQAMSLYGIPVTNPIRTAADVARDLPADQALIALRRLGELSSVRPHQVAHLLGGMRYARGAATARRVVGAWAQEP